MIGWFKKQPLTPVEAPPKEPTQITFEYGDAPMVRAEKIWRALGFVNDRLGSIPALAGYLSMYRDWDKLPPDYYSKQENTVGDHGRKTRTNKGKKK